jgi:hypothetical protein
MLACLVASMTVGATVLDWSQPATSAELLPGPQLTAQLRDAVRHVGQDDGAGHRWRAIRIEPHHQGSADAGAACHFLIRRDGTFELMDDPQAQRRLAEEGVIGIALEVSASSNQTTRVQSRTARQLILSLQRAYGIPSQAVLTSDALKSSASASSSRPVERSE